MCYAAVVSKETEQSHGEESSAQGSLSHGAFWGAQVLLRERSIRRRTHARTPSASPSGSQVQPMTERQVQHTEEVPLLGRMNMKHTSCKGIQVLLQIPDPIPAVHNPTVMGPRRHLPYHLSELPPAGEESSLPTCACRAVQVGRIGRKPELVRLGFLFS